MMKNDLFTAKHRNYHDRPKIIKIIGELATTIGQLTSNDPDHAIIPITKILTDY